MTGMMENAFINVKNPSYTITAQVKIPRKNANGVIICRGGRFGGWTLYLKDGRPIYTYNWVGLQRYTVEAEQPIAPGKATIRFDFAYDGATLGAGGTGAIYVDGKEVARARIDKTNAMMFSADEGADVGVDEGTPVTEDYKTGDSKFTGKIYEVTIAVQSIGTDVKDKEDKAAEQFLLDKAAQD
jgi:hypothetical protein